MINSPIICIKKLWPIAILSPKILKILIYTALLNIAIFQGAVLGFVILKSSLFNSTSNKYLAYLLFTLSILLLNHVLELEGTYIPYPFLRFMDDVEWAFLLPAFLFLFVTNRVDDATKAIKNVFVFYSVCLFCCA